MTADTINLPSCRIRTRHRWLPFPPRMVSLRLRSRAHVDRHYRPRMVFSCQIYATEAANAGFDGVYYRNRTGKDRVYD